LLQDSLLMDFPGLSRQSSEPPPFVFVPPAASSRIVFGFRFKSPIALFGLLFFDPIAEFALSPAVHGLPDVIFPKKMPFLFRLSNSECKSSSNRCVFSAFIHLSSQYEFAENLI